jgi:hydrogenase assembly chaperone HypC/HupF
VFGEYFYRMCLAEPGRVLELIEGGKARVDFMGENTVVDVSMLSGLRRGDYVLAHGLLAIQKLEREDALETLELIDELGHVHCRI